MTRLYSSDTQLGTPVVVLEVTAIDADHIVLSPADNSMQEGGTGTISFPLRNPDFARGWEVGDEIEFELLRRIRPGSGTVQRRRS
jgi:hypothetical protein